MVLLNERREKYYSEHPNENFDAEYWKDMDRIQLEERKKRIKEQRSIDTNYGLSDKLRSKVRRALNRKSSKTQDSYNELIGCSINELRRHLESNFLEGMSWANCGTGGWHIDHVLPYAVYDLKDPDEQKKCFHYSNLQPMWAIINFDKNASFQTNFDSINSLNEFINTHKMPASSKTKIKINKVGKTIYRISFKIHK
jgi:hypothetical protein